MFHIINVEPSVNYSNMKEDHFIILNLISKKGLYGKPRTHRIIKLIYICKDYLYYLNTQILSGSSFNMNKIYANIIHTNI